MDFRLGIGLMYFDQCSSLIANRPSEIGNRKSEITHRKSTIERLFHLIDRHIAQTFPGWLLVVLLFHLLA